MRIQDTLKSVLTLLGVSPHFQTQLERISGYTSHETTVDPEVLARLPVSEPTRAYWTHSSPDANPLEKYGSHGDLTKDADICIIGSGITGVSSAYHLSRLWTGEKPLKTVVFEARDFCSGATGRNGGHLTPYSFQHFRQKEALLGPEEAKKGFLLEHYTVDALLKIIHEHGLEDKVDLVSGGHLSLYQTRLLERVGRRDYFAAEDAGMNVSDIEWLKIDDVWMQYGTDHPASRGPGHNVWPLKLVTELFHLANSSTALDLHLHTGTPVTFITSLSSTPRKHSTFPRRWSLKTARGTTACSHVITASNAYAPALHSSLRGETGIVPVRSQIIATRAAIAAKDMSMASWDSDIAYWFPRPATDSSTNPLIIIGGARQFSPTQEWNIFDDGTVNAQVGAELRRYLPDNFPGMFEHGQKPEMEWTGIMGYTPALDPFVGPVRDNTGSPLRGQWIAAGFSGHGMPRTFASAEAVAQMLVADASGVAWTPPAWFPKHFLRWPAPEATT